jgi:hypothetical protein
VPWKAEESLLTLYGVVGMSQRAISEAYGQLAIMFITCEAGIPALKLIDSDSMDVRLIPATSSLFCEYHKARSLSLIGILVTVWDCARRKWQIRPQSEHREDVLWRSICCLYMV